MAGAAVDALQLPEVARLKLNPSQIPTVSMNCLEVTVSPFPDSLLLMDKYHQMATDCPVLVISNDLEIKFYWNKPRSRSSVASAARIGAKNGSQLG